MSIAPFERAASVLKTRFVCDSEQRSNLHRAHLCRNKIDVEVTGLLQTTFATLGSTAARGLATEAELKADQSKFL